MYGRESEVERKGGVTFSFLFHFVVSFHFSFFFLMVRGYTFIMGKKGGEEAFLTRWIMNSQFRTDTSWADIYRLLLKGSLLGLNRLVDCRTVVGGACRFGQAMIGYAARQKASGKV
jgi:hypothetical protein